MSGRLEGRRIAVAGAGGGLGPHVVRALAGEGAWVAAGDLSVERLGDLAPVAGDLRAVDLSSDDGARAWAAAVAPVDALVHLVGGWRGGSRIDELDLADLELLERLLLRTVVHATRAFAPLLRDAGARGRFALVSSSVAARPTAGNAAYAATKAAAEAWTLAFGRELADTGGTANVVVVNAIVTPEMREAQPEKAFATFTGVAEIADGLAFVLSDAARAMNGQRLSLHGG